MIDKGIRWHFLGKEKLLELIRLAWACLLGGTVVWYFLHISPPYQAEGDSLGLYRYIIFEIPKGTWLVMAMGLGASFINWCFNGMWWHELREKNMAVGIATAGLWIGLGIALHKGL